MSAASSAAVWFGRMTELLPAKYNQALWRILRLAKRQPVYRLTGKSRTGEVCAMIVAGTGPVGDYLPTLFFDGEYRQESVGAVSIFQLPGCLKKLREMAEMTVVRTDVILASLFFGSEYLRVPEWVRSSMSVPAGVDALQQLSGSLRQDLRLVRKNRFQPVESRDEADLKLFYETMFRPHTVGRHRAATYLKSYKELKTLWQLGCLIWVELAGERVAGMVVSIKGKTLLFSALGTRDGDEGLLRKGALSAAYLFSMDYARAHGCKKIDLGGTRPSLTDGLLRYKGKWGANLDPKPTNPVYLLTYWPVASPSILAMLSASPLIFRDGNRLCSILSGDNDALLAATTMRTDYAYTARAEQPLRPLTSTPSRPVRCP